MDEQADKTAVAEYWNAGACGEVYRGDGDVGESLREAARQRYALEPYIEPFAGFESGRDRDVLEIGLGMGCDHVQWAAATPRSLHGVDITDRAIELTGVHLQQMGLESTLQVGDAERLPFASESFDIVYSFGVLHHFPDTPRAINEVLRVLRPCGRAAIMIYHRRSLTGYMLWLRYGLLRGRPFVGLSAIYSERLESPGTKAYTKAEAEDLFGGFSDVSIEIQLNHGDLLEGEAGQRHRGLLLRTAKSLWPRWLFRRVLKNHGLYLMINARK